MVTGWEFVKHLKQLINQKEQIVFKKTLFVNDGFKNNIPVLYMLNFDVVKLKRKEEILRSEIASAKSLLEQKEAERHLRDIINRLSLKN